MSTDRSGDQTVIRRTIIERGVRSNEYPAGRANEDARRNINNQHEEEKRTMQELNNKFVKYLDRVKFLESQNQKLQGLLNELKAKWGKKNKNKQTLSNIDLFRF
jgi:chromosome segregation ATPase